MNLDSLTKKLKHESPEVIDRVRQTLLQRELAQDFYLFCKWLGYKEINPDTHSTIIHALQSPTTRKIIVEPRGSFKSTIGSICYPLWRVMKNPDLRVLIDSELYSNSITYLRAIKAHVQCEAFSCVYGPIAGELWREDSVSFTTRSKTLKEASITCGGVGTTKVGQHYDLIIGDDYNSPSNSDTKDKAQKVIDHYRYNLNILEPGGEYVIIGTRYSENDLIGWILREMLKLNDLSEGKV